MQHDLVIISQAVFELHRLFKRCVCEKGGIKIPTGVVIVYLGFRAVFLGFALFMTSIGQLSWLL